MHGRDTNFDSERRNFLRLVSGHGLEFDHGSGSSLDCGDPWHTYLHSYGHGCERLHQFCDHRGNGFDESDGIDFGYDDALRTRNDNANCLRRKHLQLDTGYKLERNKHRSTNIYSSGWRGYVYLYGYRHGDGRLLEYGGGYSNRQCEPSGYGNGEPDFDLYRRDFAAHWLGCEHLFLDADGQLV